MILSREKIETPKENPYDNLPIKSKEDLPNNVEREKQKENEEKSESGKEDLRQGKSFYELFFFLKRFIFGSPKGIIT